jgi:hypothetical protein
MNLKTFSLTLSRYMLLVQRTEVLQSGYTLKLENALVILQKEITSLILRTVTAKSNLHSNFAAFVSLIENL